MATCHKNHRIFWKIQEPAEETRTIKSVSSHPEEEGSIPGISFPDYTIDASMLLATSTGTLHPLMMMRPTHRPQTTKVCTRHESHQVQVQDEIRPRGVDHHEIMITIRILSDLSSCIACVCCCQGKQWPRFAVGKKAGASCSPEWIQGSKIWIQTVTF